MKRLVAIESPMSAVASAVASTKSIASVPQASRIESAISRAGTCRSGSCVKPPTGATSALITARV
jgi:hypothetical protein